VILLQSSNRTLLNNSSGTLLQKQLLPVIDDANVFLNQVFFNFTLKHVFMFRFLFVNQCFFYICGKNNSRRRIGRERERERQRQRQRQREREAARNSVHTHKTASCSSGSMVTRSATGFQDDLPPEAAAPPGRQLVECARATRKRRRSSVAIIIVAPPCKQRAPAV